MPGSSPTMERRDAGEAIEEGGLADVGAAADGDQRAGRGLRRGLGGEVELSGEDFGFAPGAEFRRRIRFRRGRCWWSVESGGRRCRRWGRPCLGEGVDFGAMVWRDSFSGERVGVRFFFSSSARLAARVLRLRGSTAPVVGVTRGARPFLGRVDASRCFLPKRLRSGRCAMVIPCSLFPRMSCGKGYVLSLVGFWGYCGRRVRAGVGEFILKEICPAGMG